MRLRRYLNKWVWVAAGGVGVLLCILAAVVSSLLRLGAPEKPAPTAEMLLIFPPTPTPTLPVLPTSTPSSEVVGDIGVGMYVQITGTEGFGLKLRAGPGTGYSPNFVGMDSEVFEVIDGPQSADGYTWWYLTAPYDSSRSGWAAANYLTVVSP